MVGARRRDVNPARKMSAYTHHLRVGMLAAGYRDKVVLIVPDPKGVCMPGFIMVVDIKTGRQAMQLARHMHPLKT